LRTLRPSQQTRRAGTAWWARRFAPLPTLQLHAVQSDPSFADQIRRVGKATACPPPRLHLQKVARRFAPPPTLRLLAAQSDPGFEDQIERCLGCPAESRKSTLLGNLAQSRFASLCAER